MNIFLILSLSLFAFSFASGVCPGEPYTDEVIGTLNGEPILLSEVEENVAFQVYRLRGNIYHLLKRETEEIANQRLLAAEAVRRGISGAELLRREVEGKVPPLEERQVDDYLLQHPEESKGLGPEARIRIRTYLSQRALMQRKLDFIASLREKADFRFLLQEPRRPRISVKIAGEPWRGNPDAPVTVVHFASFTSKLCAESAAMIKRVMAAFPGRVKWVHRNFFSIHDERALTGAALGAWAQEEGRFWDFHDMVFSRGGELKVDEMMQVAYELELDTERYEAAKREGRYLVKVKKDIGYGVRIGVTGVPVIFVNGIYMSGTLPFEDLKGLVQQELERQGRTERKDP